MAGPVRDFLNKRKAAREQELRWRHGIQPAPEAQEHFRRQRIRDLGLVDPDATYDVDWLHISWGSVHSDRSTNVDAVRWVGGSLYPLQVRFLSGAIYEYQTDVGTYVELQTGPSAGKGVWDLLRRPGVPYRRVA